MKKSKLSKGLVASFVASLVLAGCNSVTSKENSILSFTNYDGTKSDIVTEAMYQSYREDSGAISTFYDKILEVLIRDYFEKNESEWTLPITKSYATIKGLAEADVEAAKVKATENSKTNGTSYETEWDAILSGESVEDEEELLQKYIYNQEKEALEDALYTDLTRGEQGDTLKSDWIKGALPYHVRHILANVDSGTSNYTRGTITADQAKRIFDIGEALALSNDTFGGVAQRLSQDETSGKVYGDVGLVTNKAGSAGTFGMVQEFQMAVYIYDVLYHGRDVDSDEYKALFGEKAPHAEAAAVAFNDEDQLLGKITKVPYEVFKLLANKNNGGLGDVTTSPDKKIVGEGEEAIYPRNILWNKYLNHHEPFVITDESLGDYADDGTELTPKQIHGYDAVDPVAPNPNKVGADHLAVPAAAQGKTGFRAVEDLGIAALATKVGAGTKILTDENLNPIFGVRSQYGIHLVIIQKSAFDANLSEYYQVYSPKQAEYPKDDAGKAIVSYVNYAGFDDSTMTTRASSVKSAVKDYDGTYQYKLYDRLLSEAANRFNLTEEPAKSLIQEINEYTTLQAEKNAYDQEKGYDLGWENFMLKFEEQQEERQKYERIVPWGCAIGFRQNLSEADYQALYGIGGYCYYGNKTK